MKRILLTVAISSLLAMSFVHAADTDGMGTDPMMQAPVGDAADGGMGPLADNSDTSGTSQNGNIGSTPDTSNSSPDTTSNTNDDMSADTATGDDDY